jgi:hypothetical protein
MSAAVAAGPVHAADAAYAAFLAEPSGTDQTADAGVSSSRGAPRRSGARRERCFRSALCSLMRAGTVCTANGQTLVMTTLVFRRSICRLLIGVLASTQFAVAAYACSGMPRMALLEQDRPADAAATMGDPGRAVTMASDGGAAANQGDGMGAGSNGMDPTLPNLCAAHCHYGQQSADHASTLAVPAAMLTSLYTLPSLDESSELTEPLAGPQAPLAAADPPHAVLHCCLRN